jgi:hypothetical protein
VLCSFWTVCMFVSLCTFQSMCLCFNLVDESYCTDTYNPLSYGNEAVCVQPGNTTRRNWLERDLSTLPRLVNVIVHMAVFLATIWNVQVFRITMIIISRMMLWPGFVTRIVQKRNAIGSDEQNPVVGANGTVQWRICSLPMGLTSGYEFVTHFESIFFLRSRAQMGR